MSVAGTISFSASTTQSLEFDGVELVLGEPGIKKVAIHASPEDRTVQTTVHVAGLASIDDAQALASQVVSRLLDSLSFRQSVGVGIAQKVDEQLSELTEAPGEVCVDVPQKIFFKDNAEPTLKVDANLLQNALRRPGLSDR